MYTPISNSSYNKNKKNKTFIWVFHLKYVWNEPSYALTNYLHQIFHTIEKFCRKIKRNFYLAPLRANFRCKFGWYKYHMHINMLFYFITETKIIKLISINILENKSPDMWFIFRYIILLIHIELQDKKRID